MEYRDEENVKILLNDIKENLNGDTKYFQLSKLTYRFNSIPIKILTPALFRQTVIIEFIEINNHSKTYKSTINKTVCDQYQCRKTNEKEQKTQNRSNIYLTRWL